MSRSSRPPRPPARRGRLRLVIALGAAAVLGTYIAAPDLIHDLLPKPQAPRSPGNEPVVTGLANARVSDRTVNLQPVPPAVESLAKRQEPPAAPSSNAQAPQDQPRAAQPMRGSEGLARAEAALKALRMDEAQRLAASLLGGGADPSVAARAQQVLRSAKALAELFERLDGRRELSRSIDTHPSLVLVTVKGRETALLPVDNLNDKNPIESPDPVAWVRNALQSGADVAFLAPPGGIATAYKAADISGVAAADVGATRAERQAVLDGRLERFFASPDLQRDPLAWYEAGRYAYQNRLDERVVELLGRALLLEPDLATAIREEAARGEFANLMRSMEEKNAQRAAGFMAYLRKNYADTRVFAQAEAYYSGNLEAMAKARRAEEEQLAQRRQRDAEVLQKAKEAGDKELVKVLEKERSDVEEEPEALSVGKAGTSEADGYLTKGQELMGKAIAMPATAARDALYAQAVPWFRKAQALYNAEIRKGDKSLEPKLVRASQGLRDCMKFQRAFH